MGCSSCEACQQARGAAAVAAAGCTPACSGKLTARPAAVLAVGHAHLHRQMRLGRDGRADGIGPLGACLPAAGSHTAAWLSLLCALAVDCCCPGAARLPCCPACALNVTGALLHALRCWPRVSAWACPRPCCVAQALLHARLQSRPPYCGPPVLCALCPRSLGLPLCRWLQVVSNDSQEPSTLMHELGHTQGLNHAAVASPGVVPPRNAAQPGLKATSVR